MSNASNVSEPEEEVAKEALRAITEHPEKAEAVQARREEGGPFLLCSASETSHSQAVMNASLSPGLTTLSELMDVLKALKVGHGHATGYCRSTFLSREIPFASRRCQGVLLSTCWWPTSRRSWPT